ncbi:MAG: D-glycerate dehydrogenase [Geminicoccaceae bacterium]|nr:D-glycerate dehydrogenase [Geminicoccaceae bacterium]
MATIRPRVLVTRRLPDAVVDRLHLETVPILNGDDRELTQAMLLQATESVDAILTCSTEKWTDDLVAALAPQVRLIATYSVGTDHIDLEACRTKGITVTNTPDVLTEATADITMLCLLAASRRAFENQAKVRNATWDRWSPTDMLGVGLQGRNLGIVGMGRIGRAVAHRARAFGLTIHYHNRSRLPEEFEQGATYHETLEDLLPHCHFLTLNCPGTMENSNIINEYSISLLPRDSVIVNTARGNLVNDTDLIAALQSGRVFAAGLDVFAGEPNIHPAYRDLPNTFLLPHLGSATVDTRNAMGFRCLDNIRAFFEGKEPPDRVV